MRESGEAFVETLGVTEGMDVLDVGSGDGTTAVPAAQRGANVLGVDISAPLVAAGNARARGARPVEPQVPGRRCVSPRRPRRRQLRPRRQHLRRDVRAAAVRRREGARARDAARRPDRDGQLDPRRPDPRRADPADQLGVLTAPAGGIRQPDDVGRRERRRSSGSPPPACPKTRSRSSAPPRRSTTRARRRSSSPSSASTTGRR